MFIPNLDPGSFTGTAIILGYLLSADFTIEEQAAIGAWFNIIGDILISNSSWGAVLQKRVDDFNDENKEGLDVLKEAIDKLKESVEQLYNEKKSNQ